MREIKLYAARDFDDRDITKVKTIVADMLTAYGGNYLTPTEDTVIAGKIQGALYNVFGRLYKVGVTFVGDQEDEYCDYDIDIREYQSKNYEFMVY